MAMQGFVRLFHEYFALMDCSIVSYNDEQITTKLSIEADRILTNRPFYWSYIDRTNLVPETLQFTFIFSNPSSDINQEHGFVEYMTMGNDKFTKIMQDIHKNGGPITVYEKPKSHAKPGIYESWLNVNLSVHLQTFSTRSYVMSIGVSLATGEIVHSFLEQIEAVSLLTQIPPNHHLKPIISLQTAEKILHTYIQTHLQAMDQMWSDDAYLRYADKKRNLEASMDSSLERTQTYIQKETELHERYNPVIQVEIINCGVFHLLNHLKRT
jgi:hypothetical protein